MYPVGVVGVVEETLCLTVCLSSSTCVSWVSEEEDDGYEGLLGEDECGCSWTLLDPSE